MTRLDELHDLFSYHRWANGRILAAAAELSPQDRWRDLHGSFPSVAATLEHLLGAEWIWLRRWEGSSPTAPPDWQVSTAAALRARWREVEAQQRAFVDGLGEEDLDRPLRYHKLGGAEFTNPLGQLLRHVVNHGTYHRGQVATMLRQLGVTPPATDLIVYYREREG